jgi:hypothetical protein
MKDRLMDFERPEVVSHIVRWMQRVTVQPHDVLKVLTVEREIVHIISR